MKFEQHVAIGPWARCVYEACIFDNYPEFQAAQVLDRTESVAWWARNDPAVLVIPTPVGGFEPDFLYLRKKSELAVCGVLEVKGDFLWKSPQQPDRIKAEAARQWVKKANEISFWEQWEITVVGDQEAKTATVLGDLLSVSLLYEGPGWLSRAPLADRIRPTAPGRSLRISHSHTRSGTHPSRSAISTAARSRRLLVAIFSRHSSAFGPRSTGRTCG
jgi:hypothetical protein